ncbi:MAG: DNA alkylation repair protein [Actinomycetota bacterium]|nr:DNA alkylation repair protein [Actinomycetota bacterium]
MDADGLTAFVADRLAAVADPKKAGPMAAYMKTDMPFHGVQKAGRAPILRDAVKRFPPSNRDDYRSAVLALWGRPYREEKYLAIGYARAFPRYITLSSVPLYRRMIVEGAWWDLVDETAIHLVGLVLLHQRAAMTPKIEAWIDDRDMWLRRTSILAQIGHKADTDTDLLFDACERRMHETGFFIRKAIGWALRDYAKADAAAVTDFVTAHRDGLSGLSYREATKHLDL